MAGRPISRSRPQVAEASGARRPASKTSFVSELIQIEDMETAGCELEREHSFLSRQSFLLFTKHEG